MIPAPTTTTDLWRADPFSVAIAWTISLFGIEPLCPRSLQGDFGYEALREWNRLRFSADLFSTATVLLLRIVPLVATKHGAVGPSISNKDRLQKGTISSGELQLAV